MRARDIMTSPVITVRPGTIVTEADLVRDRFPHDARSLIHGEPPGGSRRGGGDR